MSDPDAARRRHLRRQAIARRARIVAAKREQWVEAQVKYVDNRDGAIVVRPQEVEE